MIQKSIQKLFTDRDKAVKTKDKKLFLSTQVGEVQGSSFDGYISVDGLTTEVITEHDDKELENKVIFVKETYFPAGKDTYFSYVTYYLVETVRGWRIYRLTYA